MGYTGKQKGGKWALILAAVCAAAGIVCCFVYTPMRFSGFLLFCAAVYFALWFALGRMGRGRVRTVLRAVMAAALIVGLVVFAALEARVVSYGHTDEESDVLAVVILGAGVNGTRPSLSLQARLDAALDYVADKPDIPIVVTGSQGSGEDISEGRCMAQWLEEHGIAPERILIDEQADNTEENVRYAKELLRGRGVDTTGNIAVVTANYHLYRTSLYWGPQGGMVPVAAHMPESYWILDVNYYVREAFAVAALYIL